MNRFVAVSLFTGDVEAAKGFYRRLLVVPPETERPGGAIFAAGDARVLLHERSALLPGAPSNEDHVAIAVPDLKDACEDLIAQG